jgi:hypothetical protein
MPCAVTGALVAWTIAYGRQAKRKGERIAAAKRARGLAPEHRGPLTPCPLNTVPPNPAPLA